MALPLKSELSPVSEKSAKVREIGYAIDIVSLSKRFKRHTLRSGYSTVKSSFINLLFRRNQEQPVLTVAVEDLTLRIPKGASVGIIGRNGSGKSTLLKLITGIYKPDTGHVRVNGRVAALIELGAGFHPDFTGRENLYLAGIMLGLSRREIDERFEEIVHFAELEEVIDDPVRTYSSGMFMRLGFSIAVHTNPDVLLVDEVLAVGDAGFVAKCKDRIAELRKSRKTLLLVTHDLEAVERWCDEVLWLDKGKVRDRGDPRRVIDHYRQFLERGEELELETKQEEREQELEAGTLEGNNGGPQRWGSREVEIQSIRMLNAQGSEALLFHPDDKVTIEFEYVVREPNTDIVFGIGINRNDGLPVFGSNTDIERVTLPRLGSKGTVRYNMKRIGLLEGAYSIDLAVHREDGYPYDYHKAALSFVIRSPLRQLGVFVPEHTWEIS